jgi:hypothetical protein
MRVMLGRTPWNSVTLFQEETIKYASFPGKARDSAVAARFIPTHRCARHPGQSPAQPGQSFPANRVNAARIFFCVMMSAIGE